MFGGSFGRLVGWSVGWSVGRLVGWSVVLSGLDVPLAPAVVSAEEVLPDKNMESQRLWRCWGQGWGQGWAVSLPRVGP